MWRVAPYQGEQSPPLEEQGKLSARRLCLKEKRGFAFQLLCLDGFLGAGGTRRAGACVCMPCHAFFGHSVETPTVLANSDE